MDANQQIVDSKRVIYRFAAQIIEVSDIDNCCLATINRHLEDASIEEAQGAGLDRGGAAFTVEQRIREYARRRELHVFRL